MVPIPPTELVGRRDLIDRVGVLLRRNDVRLVTLTGPGGIGKTRVAIEVARFLVNDFTDVWFVPLASTGDADLVAATIGRALGVQESPNHSWSDVVERRLTDGAPLLIVDNFERVLGAAPQLSEWLSANRSLKLLVTSRAVLHLAGEHAVPVPALSVPEPMLVPAMAADAIAANDAVRLFVSRAMAASAGFQLTGSNAAAVAQICRRLEGVPLAIELAAAWIRSLPPRALLARLDHRLPLLVGGPRDTPARLQSVRSAVAWSYDALDGSEQRLFRHLAVFAGGWTIEAADAVIGGGSALALLTSLVDKSLVGADESIDSEPRFGMLETVKEYAAEMLQEHGETLGARERHAVYFLEFAIHADTQLAGPEQAGWYARLEIEHDNLRLALVWAQETGDTILSLQLTAALAWFWRVRSHLTEGRRWLGAALEASRSDSQAILRARVLNGAGFLAFAQLDFDAATIQFRGALALAREADDGVVAGWALHGLGRVALHERRFDEADELLEESIGTFHRMGEERGVAYSRFFLGAVRGRRAPEQADRLFAESLAVLKPMGDTWGLCGVTWHWANVALATGDLHAATEQFVGCLGFAVELDSTWMIGGAVWGLALCAIAGGHFERGVTLYAAAERLNATVGVPASPAARAFLERAQSHLSGQSMAAAWRRGSAMRVDEAVGTALDRDPQDARASSDASSMRLSGRERQVLALLASGRSNQDIADELVLSVRTVENHVARIYQKLDVRSRVQATVYALRHGLSADQGVE